MLTAVNDDKPPLIKGFVIIFLRRFLKLYIDNTEVKIV